MFPPPILCQLKIINISQLQQPKNKNRQRPLQQQKNEKNDTKEENAKTDDRDMNIEDKDNKEAECSLQDDNNNVEISKDDIPDAKLSNSSTDFDSLYDFQVKRLLHAIQETKKSREIVKIMMKETNPSQYQEDDYQNTTNEEKVSLVRD
jgi:hypothetical protein